MTHSIITVRDDQIDALTRHLARTGLQLVAVGHGPNQCPRYALHGLTDSGTQLTEREMQVLTGMSEGHSNATIGRQLYVSEDTVKTHARRLFHKLGARDRAHAVAIAYQLGILRTERTTS